MKPRRSNKLNAALTLTEVLVVVGILVLLAVLLLPALIKANQRPGVVSCAGLVKQICLSSRVWANDHNDKYPIEISTANGGTMELVAKGDAFSTFQVMSNEILDVRILHCPFDTDHSIFPIAPGPRFLALMPADFSGDLKNHVSYFIGLDASINNPRALLCGDDNFEIGGAPVKPGLLELSTNTSVAWTSRRHTTYKRHFWDVTTSFGNVGLADGGVQQTTMSSHTNFVQRSNGTITTSLTSLLQATGLATNRLAIP